LPVDAEMRDVDVTVPLTPKSDAPTADDGSFRGDGSDGAGNGADDLLRWERHAAVSTDAGELDIEVQNATACRGCNDGFFQVFDDELLQKLHEQDALK
jgi:hypothetical protein